MLTLFFCKVLLWDFIESNKTVLFFAMPVYSMWRSWGVHVRAAISCVAFVFSVLSEFMRGCLLRVLLDYSARHTESGEVTNSIQVTAFEVDSRLPDMYQAFASLTKHARDGKTRLDMGAKTAYHITIRIQYTKITCPFESTEQNPKHRSSICQL